MIDFEIKSKTQPIGTRKGQTVYFAQPGVFRPAQEPTVFHEQDAHRAHCA